MGRVSIRLSGLRHSMVYVWALVPARSILASCFISSRASIFRRNKSRHSFTRNRGCLAFLKSATTCVTCLGEANLLRVLPWTILYTVLRRRSERLLRSSVVLMHSFSLPELARTRPRFANALVEHQRG